MAAAQKASPPKAQALAAPADGAPAPMRRSEKVSENVAREIIHDIAARRLTPGTMLPPEAVMLAKFRVGRASLREALRLLEVQGLIVIRPGPGGGPMVAAAESQHFGRMATLYLHLLGGTFAHLVEARLALEPVMARLAAERRDVAGIERLRRFVQEGPPVVTDNASYLAMSTEFHSLICSMSGNPVLDLIGRGLKDIYTDRLQGMTFASEDREHVVQDHLDIANAILRGNTTKAEQLMRDHMVEFAKASAERYPGLLDETIDWI